MNASELRTAAEYFSENSHCECDPESGVFNCMGCDIACMARHILATVRADDEFPATVEWCDSTSLPLSDTGPYQRRYELTGGVRLVAEACPGGFKPCTLFTGSGDGFRSRDINRRQVRDLCRVLGVPLSEA